MTASLPSSSSSSSPADPLAVSGLSLAVASDLTATPTASFAQILGPVPTSAPPPAAMAPGAASECIGLGGPSAIVAPVVPAPLVRVELQARPDLSCRSAACAAPAAWTHVATLSLPVGARAGEALLLSTDQLTVGLDPGELANIEKATGMDRSELESVVALFLPLFSATPVAPQAPVEAGPVAAPTGAAGEMLVAPAGVAPSNVPIARPVTADEPTETTGRSLPTATAPAAAAPASAEPRSRPATEVFVGAEVATSTGARLALRPSAEGKILIEVLPEPASEPLSGRLLGLVATPVRVSSEGSPLPLSSPERTAAAGTVAAAVASPFGGLAGERALPAASTVQVGAMPGEEHSVTSAVPVRPASPVAVSGLADGSAALPRDTAAKTALGRGAAQESGISSAVRSQKTFLSADSQLVGISEDPAGIAVAKSAAAMPHPTSVPSTMPLPAAGWLAAASPVAQAVEWHVADTAFDLPSRAAAVVQSVLEVTEAQAVSRLQPVPSVTLRFDFEGEPLAVRVEMRDGEVRTEFRTDSADLKVALAHEWRSVAAQSEAGVRIADPVFGQPARGNDSAPHGGWSQQFAQSNHSGQSREQFTTSRSMRATRTASNLVAADPIAAPAPRPSTSQRLSVLV